MSKSWWAFKKQQYEEQDKNVKYLKIKEPETIDEYYANNRYLGDKDKVLREIKQHLDIIALRKRSDERGLGVNGTRLTLDQLQFISPGDSIELQKKIAKKAAKIYDGLVEKNELKPHEIEELEIKKIMKGRNTREEEDFDGYNNYGDDDDYWDHRHPDDARSEDDDFDLEERATQKEYEEQEAAQREFDATEKFMEDVKKKRKFEREQRNPTTVENREKQMKLYRERETWTYLLLCR